MLEDEKTADHLKLEYAELGQNLRFYADARFKWFTLFVALTTALAGASFQFDDVKKIAVGAGIALTLAFIVFERRYGDYWWVFLRRAKEIEERLGLRQYQNLKHASCLSSTNVMLIVYLSMIAVWGIVLTTT